MESLRIIPDLEKVGFEDDDYVVTEYTNPLVIGGMPKGTENGLPVVMIGLKMEEGYLVAQTTLALFLSAADAIKARYGDPRE